MGFRMSYCSACSAIFLRKSQKHPDIRSAIRYETFSALDNINLMKNPEGVSIVIGGDSWLEDAGRVAASGEKT